MPDEVVQPAADGGAPGSGQDQAAKPDAAGQSGTGKPQSQQQHQQQQPPPGSRPGSDGQSDADRRGLIADLQKERTTRAALQKQIDTLTRDFEQAQNRIKALAGVQVTSPEDAEVEAVRARVVQMFPVLGKLDDETLSKLLASQESIQGLREVEDLQWTRHAQNTVGEAQAQIADALGVDALDDKQKKFVARAFVSQVENDPAFYERYKSGDPTLVADFVKEFSEQWVTAARKAVVTQETGRLRPVPDGRGRHVRTTPPKQINFKDDKAVADALVESFKAHGGSFGS